MMSDRGQYVGKQNEYIEYLFYSIIIFAFLSPYFTPPSTIGPDGILRIDQIFMAITVVLAILLIPNRLSILINGIVVILFMSTTVITIGFLNGLFSHNYPFRLGDTFNSIRWATYTIFVATVFTYLKKRTLNYTVGLLIILGTFISIIGILQANDIGGPIAIIDAVYTPERRAEKHLRRANGTTINPNMMAQLIIIPLFLSIAITYRLFEDSWGRIYKYAMIAPLIIIFTGMYYTYSRTGMIATIVGTSAICSIVLFEKIGKRYNRAKIRNFLSLSFLTVFLLISIFQIEIGRYTTSILSDRSFQIRISRWSESIPVILDSYLIGHGPSRRDIPVSDIDSGILEWWFHHGIIGVLLFVIFVVLVARYSLSLAIKREIFQQEPIVWALSAAVVGWTAAIPFVWIFLPVESYTRPFTIYLSTIVLLFTYYNGGIWAGRT